MSSKIILYHGPGVDPFCAAVLARQVQELCDDRIYRIYQESSFLGHYSDPGQPVKALFVPGGNAASMAVSSDLGMRFLGFSGKRRLYDRSGMRLLEADLEKGKVSYGGVCAGGVLACSGLHERFSEGMHPEPRYRLEGTELANIFPTEVLAPLFPKIPHGTRFSIADLHFDPVVFPERPDFSLRVIHSLSPGFFRYSANTEVLTKYGSAQPEKYVLGKEDSQEVQCVSRDEVAGTIYEAEKFPKLLTAAHFEIDAPAIRSESFRHACLGSLETQEALAAEMDPTDALRKDALRGFIQKLGIVCKV